MDGGAEVKLKQDKDKTESLENGTEYSRLLESQIIKEKEGTRASWSQDSPVLSRFS